ncbi:MAG TPA: tyrosine-type recombinase/integrase, partial [Dehalococcoidia bacterium]|nr:tyrosine-type recombinase/integrase [Dehalococcoidia bacterium]
PFLYQQGKLKISEVTSEDILAYLDFLAYQRGNCNAARARKLAAIKSFFNYHVDSGQLETSPAALIKSPKITEREPDYLTDDECIQLLDTVSKRAWKRVKNRDMAMIVLFLHAGIRVSELINLKFTNVDLRSGCMRITRKGNKEQYLHLNTETVKVLAKYITNRPKALNGKFFGGPGSKSLDRTAIYRLIRRYLYLAGIHKGKRGPHLLRHTFCTRLHQKGVDPLVIRDLAGHKSIATTMRYIKIENQEQVAAIGKLEFGTI